MEQMTRVEQEILDAAQKVFYRRGKDGASMQEIADEAGITRTSLNYYYRTKDKLFEAVFRDTMSHFFPKLAALISSGRNYSDFMPEMVETIIDTILERPHIPIFMLQELASNPERVKQVLEELGIEPQNTLKVMKNDSELSGLPVDPRHIILNFLSICIFPFAAKPLILPLLFNDDDEAYVTFMKQRKELVPVMVRNMIKIMN